MTQTYITYADLKINDVITFQTIDNGFGGTGQFIDRTGVVKTVGPKAAIVVSRDGEPGTWRAMIRSAKWYDRQVRREDATQNPRETDTALAEIYKRRADANHIIDRALDEAHRVVGDWKHARSQWRRSDIDVETDVRKLADTHASTPWTVYDPTKIVARLDAAHAELDQCDVDQRPLDDLYNTAPWSRFFIVTSSDSHIHSSMYCSTCRPTTEFGWLPELSGMTEADAVAANGPLLCTVCFPSAPIEWTIGRPKATYCPGIPDPESKPRRTGMHTYRRCTCGYVAIVNASGSLRKHKPKK